jgi:hypothetical protein
VAKLTEILTDTNSRVGALENDGLDDAAGIARITKLYGNIRVTATVTTSILTYQTPSNDLAMDNYTNELNIL